MMPQLRSMRGPARVRINRAARRKSLLIRLGERPRRVRMSFAQLFADYGYLAVFIGSMLEGETVLVLAGFAAHFAWIEIDTRAVLRARNFCGRQAVNTFATNTKPLQ